MTDDILIVGAGLSGCTLATLLEPHDINYTLIDARRRLGGRVLSTLLDDDASIGDSTAAVDMGPSWFWPHQRHINQLIKDYQLAGKVYEQFHTGASLIEHNNGQLQKASGYASMAGSYRLDGGMSSLITALAERITPSRLRLDCRLKSLTLTDNNVQALLDSQGQETLESYQQLVLAIPPRVAVAQVKFNNLDLQDHLDLLNGVSTWMAAEAKITMVYPTPFWREQGLSGDAISQIGPMGEIHDASPRESSLGVLFGFIGIPALDRHKIKEAIEQLCIKQMKRMFQTQEEPVQVIYKDWAQDKLTATNLDTQSPRAHPAPQQFLQNYSCKEILFAGSEMTDSENAGYLEGAIEAAQAAANNLILKRS